MLSEYILTWITAKVKPTAPIFTAWSFTHAPKAASQPVVYGWDVLAGGVVVVVVVVVVVGESAPKNI